jgi:hypothetical protein
LLLLPFAAVAAYCGGMPRLSTGAGAAAAANDAAAYFRLELLRRIAMEFVMPWVSTLFARRRQAATQRAAAAAPAQERSQSGNMTGQKGRQLVSRATAAGVKMSSPAAADAASSSVDDALKPQFDPFTGVWDVTRDMG